MKQTPIKTILAAAVLLLILIMPAAANPPAGTGTICEIIVTLRREPLSAYAGSGGIPAFIGGEDGAAMLAGADAYIGEIAAETARLCGFFELRCVYRIAFTGFCAMADASSLDEIAELDSVASVTVIRSFSGYDYLSGSDYFSGGDGYDHGNNPAVPDGSAGDSGGQGEPPPAMDYAGEGMVIALLGSGFDPGHHSLRLNDPAAAAIFPESIKPLESAGSLAPSDAGYTRAYICPKIPFAYDYLSRRPDPRAADPALNSAGTSAMGLAAGNWADAAVLGEGAGSIVITYNDYIGAAPEAQLLLMGVCTPDARPSEAAACAAIEDALLLGADVIGISSGVADGLSGAGRRAIYFEQSLMAAVSCGVSVVCPGGDFGETGRAGAGSVYDNFLGINLPPATLADYGTASRLSSFSGITAAAGAETGMLYGPYFLAGGRKIVYSDTTANYTGGGGLDFAAHFDGMTLEYVPVGGLGEPSDFAGMDLSGKLALICRGEITFVEKVTAAHEHGAAGVIIYDNIPPPAAAPDGVGVNMDLTDAPVPAVLISQSDGERLLAMRDKRVSVSSAQRGTVIVSDKKQPSASSSWGAGGDLSIGPSIAAAGGNALSIGAGGEYLLASGSEAASAIIAGSIARVRQYIRGTGISSSYMNESALADLLLRNTATPMTGDGGHPYSPRKQGAGAADADAAMRTPAVIFTEDGEGAAALGRISGQAFSMSFYIENLTDEELTYSLSAFIGCEGFIEYEEYYYDIMLDFYNEINDSAEYSAVMLPPYESMPAFASGESEPFTRARIVFPDRMGNINRAAGNHVPLTVGLEPRRRIKIKLTFGFGDDETAKEAARVYTNGYFVEGFIYLTPVNDSSGESIAGNPPELSLPFSGFTGNWDTLAIADGNAPAPAKPIWGGSALIMEYNPYNGGAAVLPGYISDADGSGYADGWNGSLASAGSGGYTFYRELCIFSPERIEGPLFLQFYALRDIASYEVRVRDGSGGVIYQYHGGAIGRYMYRNGYLNMIWLELWAGRAADNYAYIFGSGRYEIELTLRGDGWGTRVPAAYTARYPVIIDTSAPELTACEFVDGGKRLRIAVRDDYYIKNVIAQSTKQLAYDGAEFSAEAVLGAGEGAEHEIFIDMKWLSDRYFYVEVVDFADNTAVYKFDVSELIAEQLG